MAPAAPSHEPTTGEGASTAPILPQPGSFDPGVPPSSTNQATNDAYDTPSCPFCHIASTYPPYDPASPPRPPLPPTVSSSSLPSTSILNPEATSPQPQTFIVLSTPYLVAFLDIMPLSRGHVLLCTRSHRAKLTDVTPREAQELGRYLRVLSAAVSRATGVQDWNVVQNNGAAAAQVVPHMHFHVIPRPELREKGRERFTSTMFGRGMREDLDEEEAAPLAERIREMVRVVVEEEQQEEERERDGGKKDVKL